MDFVVGCDQDHVCRFQHCIGHIRTGSFMGRGNQYLQLVKVLYCKLPTFGKQLPSFAHRIRGLNHQPQRWKVSVLPQRHRKQFLVGGGGGGARN